MTQLICICCPKGCHLHVNEQNDCAVSGNGCVRGAEYGKAELLHPVRIVTSTVAVSGGIHTRCPVKTNRPVPKEAMLDIVRTLDGIVVQVPIQYGQIILRNVCGTGADIVACRPI